MYKNVMIKIMKSFGRYLSIFMIVMVGVGFFAGIQASVPDMITLADRYYKKQSLMNYKIVSSMGLTDDDVNAIKALKNADATFPSYSLDVMAKDKAIRIHAIEDKVNTVKLIEGRMPKKDKECIADSKTCKIGEHITITSDVDDKLKNTKFTVVGTAESVLYLAEDYGNTTIGDGKLSSFIFIDKDNFMLDAYTEIYITDSSTKDTTAYSKDYDNAALRLNDELVEIKPARENARYQEIYNKANQKISNSEKRLNNESTKSAKKFKDAKEKLDDNKQKLKEGKAELAKNEANLQKNTNKQNVKFVTAKTEIAKGWSNINAALTQYGIKKAELDTKIKELGSNLESLKEQLSKLPVGSQNYVQLSANINQTSQAYQGLLKLKESIETLAAKEADLNKGIKVFNLKIKEAKDKIEKGKSDITKNEAKLKEGYEKYNKNFDKYNTEITKARAKIDSAKKKLSNIEKPQWHIFDRDVVVGYSDLKAGIDVITSVAAVFPFFFILIGMLMTSNSMARMIEEERSELGTLSSIGYKENSIIFTYLFYVLSASGLGAITGFFVGCRIIPPLIYSTFKYILPSLIIQYDWITFMIIIGVTLTLMTMVTLISCNNELKHMPAVLMRPVPPKNGKKILLEKITPIWKHLSFTWKVTMRNMFRYKKRAFMTVVGVAGCTSLLLVGFGLRDSMNGVVEKQYHDFFRYDDMLILKDETRHINKDLESLFVKEQIDEPLLVKQAAFECKSDDKALNAFMIVPEKEDIFYQYFHLIGKDTGKSLNLNNNGVVITQKLSDLFKADKGDTITIKDADNQQYQLTVSDVTQNYTSNYIYMNKALYHKVFGKSVAYNSIISNNNTDEKVLAEHLIDSGFFINIVFTSDVLQKALESSKSFNSIIILIVVVASLLAMIVLYNLTSINISERTREIATLKVLGFTDGETNGYIYREAFLLTLVSIGVGLILGIFLHHFVVDAIEGTATSFIKIIKWPSYIWASLITLLFSVVMQIVTYFKLQTIDMIDSLKSVE